MYLNKFIYFLPLNMTQKIVTLILNCVLLIISILTMIHCCLHLWALKNEFTRVNFLLLFLPFFSLLGYASSSSGAGLYSDSSYGDTYGSKYPYSNTYTGYASAGGSPYAPVGPFPNPFDFQNAFANYYNSISDYNRKYG
jgi:hypothetical protein